MKQGHLAKLSNVANADRCIDYLITRPKLEMVGLGLIYGHPGLGKTTYAQRVAYSRGYVYIRMGSLMTPKTFSVTLMRAIMQHLNMGSYPVVGSSSSIFSSCIGLLMEHPEMVIIIDEIDYAFRYPPVLGAIRDLVDETLAIVILIGMQNARERLLQINRYYYDRCGVFCEFQAPSKKDIAILLATVMEVQFGEDIVDYIAARNQGTLRHTVKLIHSMEGLASVKHLERISVHDLEG